MEMEIEITYRDRTFTIRADGPNDDGEFTEAVSEILIPHQETAEWDGSGIGYPTALQCITETVWSVIETVDETDEQTTSRNDGDHVYPIRIAGNCLIPVAFRVMPDGSLTSYEIHPQEQARARTHGSPLWQLSQIAESYRAGYNTALGRWPR